MNRQDNESPAMLHVVSGVRRGFGPNRRGAAGSQLLVIFLSFILIASMSSLIAASPQQAPASQPAVQSSKPLEQMVPMRDGVKLATSIYLPQGKGPWPIVLVRTPYGKNCRRPETPFGRAAGSRL